MMPSGRRALLRQPHRLNSPTRSRTRRGQRPSSAGRSGSTWAGSTCSRSSRGRFTSWQIRRACPRLIALTASPSNRLTSSTLDNLVELVFPPEAMEPVAEWAAPAHAAAIRAAATAVPRTPFSRAFSAGVTALLRDEAGLEVPDPVSMVADIDTVGDLEDALEAFDRDAARLAAERAETTAQVDCRAVPYRTMARASAGALRAGRSGSRQLLLRHGVRVGGPVLDPWRFGEEACDLPQGIRRLVLRRQLPERRGSVGGGARRVRRSVPARPRRRIRGGRRPAAHSVGGGAAHQGALRLLP